MEWTEEGVILATRGHGESSAIVELFTRSRGRHLGLVRGGRSKRLRVALQPANTVTATWRARLEDHLGNYAIEPGRALASLLMESPHALYGFATAAAHLRLLPERDPHEGLFDAFADLLEALPDTRRGAVELARFELMVLADLGFGLDLTTCAATGTADDLAWVSPKSGRAVSRGAGAPYAERMLKLPAFLAGPEEGRNALPDEAEVLDAFRLTGFFLDRHVLEPRGLTMPPERARVLTLLAR